VTERNELGEFLGCLIMVPVGIIGLLVSYGVVAIVFRFAFGVELPNPVDWLPSEADLYPSLTLTRVWWSNTTGQGKMSLLPSSIFARRVADRPCQDSLARHGTAQARSGPARADIGVEVPPPCRGGWTGMGSFDGAQGHVGGAMNAAWSKKRIRMLALCAAEGATLE
jgi:hypothetical protein